MTTIRNHRTLQNFSRDSADKRYLQPDNTPVAWAVVAFVVWMAVFTIPLWAL